MERALHIAKVFGIPVKIHWTFGFMIFFILFLGQSNGLSAVQMIWFSLYILTLFFCVILHEFGHALTAKKYNIETQDIIISPIGGLARLKSLPDKPSQELLIAFAGPLVNVVIATLLGIIISIGFSMNPFDITEDFSQIHVFPEFLKLVFAINIALFIFNLIPAFPMDGGRILRALLSFAMPRLKATFIASWIGKILAIVFCIIAISLRHPILGFIGVFIFLMAHAEYKQIKKLERMKSTTIDSIAVQEFETINTDKQLSDTFSFHNENPNTSLLVCNELAVPVGVMPSYFIQDAIENDLGDTLVSELMSSKLMYVNGELSVQAVKDIMQKEGLSLVGVKKNGQLLGVVDRNNILDFISA